MQEIDKTSSTKNLTNLSEGLDPVLMEWFKIQAKHAYPLREAEHLIFKTLDTLAPTDTTEGMLMTQMVATHNLAMEMLMRAAIEVKVSMLTKQPCGHMAIKLLNAFTRQMDSLKQYRSSEHQNADTLVVGQVNVGAGGQSVVGKVTTSIGDTKDLSNGK